MTNTSQKLGFIGLGIMGAPMAGHLAKAGHQLFVTSRGRIRPELTEAGATVCKDAKMLAREKRE